MKLIKLSELHYIIIDDSKIKEGDYKWHRVTGIRKALVDGNYTNQFKITHSTEPLCHDENGSYYPMTVTAFSLSEIEEAVYGYSADKMAEEFAKKYSIYDTAQDDTEYGFREGFRAHQELVKDKLFTIEDMKKAIDYTKRYGSQNSKQWILNELLPSTEWDIEFDKQGKIKLL